MTIEDDEDAVVDKLLSKKEKLENNEDFKTFEDLDTDFKLTKLENLVKQSQVYSNIIADNLLKSSIKNKEDEPAAKRRKTRDIKNFFKPKEVDNSFKQPKLLTGATMKDYQLEGTEWLVSLYQNGLNGILADEMGLGKTIQSIALLAFLYENGIKGPFLVAAPLSTVGNWVREFENFTPGLPVLKYVGLKGDRKLLRNQYFKKGNLNGISVVVTSYETILKDFEYLNKVSWNFLIVDEGHRLKNINCKLITSLKKLKTSNRLLLTGTPLQNNLNELWSLLNFILPDIFHDLELFQKWFDFSNLTKLSDKVDDIETKNLIDAKIQETLINNLHQILKPFLLRRLKKNVVKNLPSKREYIVYGKLTETQSDLYTLALKRSLKKAVSNFAFREHLKARGLEYKEDDVRNFLLRYLDAEYISKSDQRGYFRAQISHDYAEQIALYEPSSEEEEDEENEDEDEDLSPVEKELQKHWDYVSKWVDTKAMNNLMMQLRLICTSPYLFYFPWEDDSEIDLSDLIESSAKLQLLDQLLPRLISKKAGSHKVLIFSQFTKMLDLIQDYCELKDLEVSRLDGSVNQENREIEISKFNTSKDVQVFLLSTRAGGLGLNLTEADSVIIFDSDWNPQVDLQAMDRVHRIGQTSPVIVYRFVLLNTIEQVILAKADSKRKLEKLVIQLGKFESLKGLMKGDKVAASKHKDKTLASELIDLLEDDRFQYNGEIEDNKLTEDELLELTDRSDEAYHRDLEHYDKFQHIQIFETTVSME